MIYTARRPISRKRYKSFHGPPGGGWVDCLNGHSAFPSETFSIQGYVPLSLKTSRTAQSLALSMPETLDTGNVLEDSIGVSYLGAFSQLRAFHKPVLLHTSLLHDLPGKIAMMLAGLITGADLLVQLASPAS